jgi:hypothetical protein
MFPFELLSSESSATNLLEQVRWRDDLSRHIEASQRTNRQRISDRSNFGDKSSANRDKKH